MSLSVLLTSMPKYEAKDLVLTDFHDAIRKRAYMYVRSPRDPLDAIIEGIIAAIKSFSILEFSIKNRDDFICIEVKDDWLQPNEYFDSVDMAFQKLAPLEGHLDRVRTEVFLQAFYFDFFTSGMAGTYGDGQVARHFFAENYSNSIESMGRVLIVSKIQNLPEDHQICFEGSPIVKR